MRARYQVVVEPEAVRLRWNEVAGSPRIVTREEFDRMILQLRSRIAGELEQRRVVLIE